MLGTSEEDKSNEKLEVPNVEVSSVNFCSFSSVWLFGTPWTAAHHASLSVTLSVSGRLLKLEFIESVMPFSHLILCHPLLLSPSIFPSIRVFSNESVLLIRWPSTAAWAPASVLPMNIQDWFPLGSPCSPRDSQESSPTPQFKSIKSSALSILYGPTLTPYISTGKIIVLTRWTFVGKEMSLLLNML